jgi:hypothetical protein
VRALLVPEVHILEVTQVQAVVVDPAVLMVGLVLVLAQIIMEAHMAVVAEVLSLTVRLVRGLKELFVLFGAQDVHYPLLM